MLLSEKSGSITCKICKKSFCSISSRNAHQRRMHQSDETNPRYTCDQCGCSYNTVKKLQQHFLAAHVKNADAAGQKKPVRCTLCKKTYCDLGSLRRHTNAVHRKVPKYECEYCGEKFCWKGKLRGHIETVHAGAKPFRCKMCPARFAKKSNIRYHELHCCENRPRD